MTSRLVLDRLALAVAVALVTVPRGISGVAEAQASADCGLEQPVFCETFDSAFDNSGGNARSGQLNGALWGVSRTLGAVNFGQGEYNAAPAARLVGCPETTQVRPPDDVVVCNGQLREATNDNPSGGFEGGGVTALATYPKQPFDWAGRTGKVSFDVANDTHGSHATWPEFWITNLPVPVPFAHLESWQALPQFGFGLRFHGSVDKNGVPSPCPQGDGKPFVGLGSAIVVNNYVGHDTETGDHSVMIRGFDCVRKATQDGQLNHYEIDVSQDQIDVYATDAGTLTPLKHLGSITNAGLGFTRGLIWLEDVHYNADKGDSNNPAASQRQHTFVWDNVGFDGPFTYRDLSFDALDNTQARSDGTVNLGKFAEANQATSWDVVGIPADATAEAVRVLFNFFHDDPPTALNVAVNGHAHQVAWPYPDQRGFTWRTFAVTIPIADLVAGTNGVTIGADQPIVTSNVNIVLVNAGALPTGTPAEIPVPADTPMTPAPDDT